jgi:hypothetical protein
VGFKPIFLYQTNSDPHVPTIVHFKSTLRHCQCQPTGTYRYHSLLLPDRHLNFGSLSSFTSMPTSTPVNVSVYLSIAHTIDTILSFYHPLTPWLAMRQSNRSPLRIGQQIGLEHVHGASFLTQPLPMYGRICAISRFVQGFVIVMASVDPQTFKAFKSTIYIAIPRDWIILPLRQSIIYRLSYRSLPRPRFTHLLDPSHGVYRSDRLHNHIEGSRTIKRS